MYGTLLILLALLQTIATARPLATNPGFQISKLIIWEVEGRNTTINFNVFDPDPLTNGTGSCSGSWKMGSGGYPQISYRQCGNSSFAWNMVKYDKIGSFTIGLEHVFIDPAIGPYPYNQMISFGKAAIAEPLVECFAWKHENLCRQVGNRTIRAPIYATSA